MRAPTKSDSLVKVACYFTDESFGYDRWIADQVGTGDRWGALLLFDSKEQRDEYVKRRGGER